MSIHPDVQAALDAARELRHRIADMRERIDDVRARRPSPSGTVIPEVDAMGRLTSLYLAPGTAGRFTSAELTTEIMAAIRESTRDAARQYQVIMETVITENAQHAEAAGDADSAGDGGPDGREPAGVAEAVR